MEEKLLHDLAKMLSLAPAQLRHIRGCEWPAEGSKINGIQWLDHLVLGRPFVWLEDENGFKDRERKFLEENGVLDSYWHCNVTKDPQSLARVQAALRDWLTEAPNAAA